MTSSAVQDSSLLREPGQISLSDLVDTFLQYIWLIIGIFILVTGVGLVYALLATPIYRADALIQVEDNKSTTLSGVQEIAEALGAGTSSVAGEIEILLSREVVLKAVGQTRADLTISPNRLPLVGNWFARGYDGNGLAEPRWGLPTYAWGGEALRLDEFSVPGDMYGKDFQFIVTADGYSIEDNEGNTLGSGVVGSPLDIRTEKGSLRIFVSDIKARPGQSFTVTRVSPITAYRNTLTKLSAMETGKQSGMIRLTYEDENLNLAQSLVNAVAQAYLAQNVERRSAEADQSLKFLDQQLPEIKKRVEQSEDALNNFRTKTNTVSVEKATDALLDQAVSVEKSRLELALKRNELLQQYKPDHPLVKAIDSQIAASARETDKVNDMVNRLPAAQRDLLRLQRDVSVNNQLYLALLNNAQQLRVAKAGTVGNVRVIDYAMKDTKPVAPKKIIIVLGAAVLGAMLGAMTAIIARLLRPTVRSAEEIEQATGLVSYASVPESAAQEKLDSSKRDKTGQRSIVEGRNQLLAVLQPDDPAIESLRSLRTGLAFALLGAQNKTIVMTGATAALGKSFISANLSVLLASAGKRVLLIESDMRRPQLGTYFGYSKVAGLSELLAGAAKLEDVLHREKLMDGVIDVLPSGQVPPNPGELLLSPALSDLLDSVQDQYDHIVIDSAPVLPVGDTLAVARHASTVFMVVRSEFSTVGEVRDAVRKLSAAGVSVKGIIFNGIKRNRVGYGYAYRYYYGYGQR